MKKVCLFVVLLSIINFSCNEKIDPQNVFENVGVDKLEEGVKEAFDYSEIESFAIEMGFTTKRELSAENSISFVDKNRAKKFLELIKKGTLKEAFEKYTPDNYKISKKKNAPINGLGNGNGKHFAANSVTEECYNKNRFFRGVGSTTGVADLNIDFHTNSSGTPYSISSYWSGFTLGLGWTQNSITGLDGTSNITSSGFIVRGVQHLTIFVEGIGSVYSYPVAYRILITCSGNVTVDEIQQ